MGQDRYHQYDQLVDDTIELATAVAAYLYDSPEAAQQLLNGTLDASRRDSIVNQLRGLLREAYQNTRCFGWDMAWWAYWSIPRDLGLVTYTKESSDLLDDFADLTYGATSWTPYAGICFLSERPDAIHMQGRYRDARLHWPDGPAISFRDGWSVWAWNGVRVPREVIDGTWTVEQILKEPNTEIRRCAVEVLAGRKGWGHIITTAGWPQVGDTIDDPANPGQVLRLYHVAGVYDQPVRLLWCVNATDERDGTRREFGLTVPADIDDALAAAAWMFNLTPQQYVQLEHAS